jgi:hypothetical protein
LVFGFWSLVFGLWFLVGIFRGFDFGFDAGMDQAQRPKPKNQRSL